MTRRVLLVSAASPYPVVTNGCARLVSDYLTHLFPADRVYLLLTRPGDWAPLGLYFGHQPVAGDLDVSGLLAHDFAFVLFIGFKETEFTVELARSLASFCLTDTYPHPDVPQGLFRGILSHRSDDPHPHLLIVGGSYDDEVFYSDRAGPDRAGPDRGGEELVLSVGRIHPDKHQLELCEGYRERIFEEYGLPLYLAGGVADMAYFREVEPYIDGVSVVSSIDPGQPLASSNWRSAREIALLCHRARLCVLASPKESFGLALIEAMACGTTCVVNGDYRGFAELDLRPHVYGNITGKRGSVVDLAARALCDDVRIDASEWARKYALRETRRALSRFIDNRL
ncbi:MAG: glycosyltransferase [Pseudomonadota bacterium]|nr:glycosyltransferase [Gammaproteobacteria bacterium]MDQ3581140.1 glycosyltransferase [Pseudomonadota bacterium]